MNVVSARIKYARIAQNSHVLSCRRAALANNSLDCFCIDVLCMCFDLDQWLVHAAEFPCAKSQIAVGVYQMGACLENRAFVTYGFVLAMAIQILLLFDSFLMCMQSPGCSSGDIMIFIESRNPLVRLCCTVSPKRMALKCGVLIINFVTNMAGVAEFRSEGEFHERLYHYFAAFLSISLFWAVHVVICLYPHRFAHAPHYKYIYIRKV